jgi:6-phosphogluconate dehydrogenase
MLPAGEPTQNVLDEAQKFLQKGDIVIDGGNAHFEDSGKRYQHLRNSGIEFLGIGVSGGVIAATNGYPLMIGGSKNAYEYLKPIFESLGKPNGGYEYFGEGGAGHFVKMVHNGIEYGIMQSLGEGFAVLKGSQYKFNLQKVAKLWQKGSLISGFMLDRTIEEGKKENVQTEIIESALNYRTRSQANENIQNSFTTKMINALRNAFGGHEIKR